METENKTLHDITNKAFEDANNYFGDDKEGKCLIIMGMDGDHCTVGMIGMGKDILVTLVDAMNEDQKFADLITLALKEYKAFKAFKAMENLVDSVRSDRNKDNKEE